MIKKSLAMASLLALGTSTMALDVQPFVGVGFGSSSSEYKQSINTPGYVFIGENSNSISDSENSFNFTVKGGAILDKLHRLSANFTNSSFDNGDVSSLIIDYDFLIPLNDKSRLYVGPHLGYSSFEGDENIKAFDMSGMSYGIQGGYIYDINTNLEFEFGLKYTKYDLKDTANQRALDGNMISVNLEIENSSTAYFGINYKF
ncbi:outer membrane beta-barrel protein [Aliarcobacter skirrowii]|uniref:outer membrane beta-barrel protein n=1 Tax=Aliarcobacter skirrowii TaxID=28200 RepID=UPI0029BEBF77|nr:outer membrane beta-barrel protein [Aliarcobacter skirrowii]MDX4048164.1 outer membrane beta-barrel protein [Aliarcobacter skirrowii]